MTSEDIKHQLIIILGSIIIGAEPLRVEVAVLGSMARRPNEPSSFRGGKAMLNHASALVSACP